MTKTDRRFLTKLPSRVRRSLSLYGVLAVTLLILGLGLLVVLLVQPPPPTYAEGWSSPRGFAEVKQGQLHRAVIDRQDRIHLAWLKLVDRKQVAFYGQLDRHGRWIQDPVSLSDLGVDAYDVAVALTSGDEPLCFWIEKGHEDAIQRLMLARLDPHPTPQLLSASPKIMRDLAVTADEVGRVFLAWSDNRQGLYDIYMTALDDQGNLSFNELRVTDSGRAFVYQPILAAGGGVVHLIYSSDQVTHEDLMHQILSASGDPLTRPLVLERASQAAVQLAGGSGQHGYLMSGVVDAEGQLRLYDWLGAMVRDRRIDRQGWLVQPPEPVLTGSQYYSLVSPVRGPDDQWLVWADLRPGGEDRFQIYIASLDTLGGVSPSTRVTYSFSDALWPTMLIDSEGSRHVMWQQSAGPYAAQLMYINDRDAARISTWQRLGFSGDGGGWSFAVALAQSAILAIITVALNAWRLAIAWAVTASAFQLLRRVGAIRSYAMGMGWAVLLAALFLTVRPETKTLGQMTIVVADAAHWVMGVVASLTVLYLWRLWKEEFHGVFAWGGVAGIWLWCYYLLNLMLILREGFAP